MISYDESFYDNNITELKNASTGILRMYDDLSIKIDNINTLNNKLKDIINEIINFNNYYEILSARDMDNKENIVPDFNNFKVNDVKYNCLWISVIDNGLAGILVENGMTPYDKGVSVVLQKATLLIKDVDKKLEIIKNTIRNKYVSSDVSMSREDKIQYISELDTEKAKSIKNKNMIYDEFRESLIKIKTECDK